MFTSSFGFVLFGSSSKSSTHLFLYPFFLRLSGPHSCRFYRVQLLLSVALPFFFLSIFSRVSVDIQSLWVYFFGASTCWHEDITASLSTFHFSSTFSFSISVSGVLNLSVLYTFCWFAGCIYVLYMPSTFK